jgi:hypothetical protein
VFQSNLSSHDGNSGTPGLTVPARGYYTSHMSWFLRSIIACAVLAPLSGLPPLLAGGPTAAQKPELPPATQATPAWQLDLQQRHAQLIAQNGPGTDAALRDQLLAMKETDQNARGISHGEPMHAGQLQMATNLREIDATLTAQLKEIVAKSGWPTIALVGIEASNAAILVLTHTQDHAWQRSLLPQLESLADAGKIDGSYVATLIDKELVSEGKLQRYGTQFKLVDGEMAMFGVEDPAMLDARRAKAFLPPEEVYKQMLSQMYHLKAGDKIVMATGPAQ